MPKKINKEELKIRCDKLIRQTVVRKKREFSGYNILQAMLSYNIKDVVPIFKAATYQVNRGGRVVRIFIKYVEFLVEESLEYPIDIYIPKVGLLRVREIDSIGIKRCWVDGEFKQRFDTPFDKSVMYRIYHEIFGVEQTDYRTPVSMVSVK